MYRIIALYSLAFLLLSCERDDISSGYINPNTSKGEKMITINFSMQDIDFGNDEVFIRKAPLNPQEEGKTLTPLDGDEGGFEPVIIQLTEDVFIHVSMEEDSEPVKLRADVLEIGTRVGILAYVYGQDKDENGNTFDTWLNVGYGEYEMVSSLPAVGLAPISNPIKLLEGDYKFVAYSLNSRDSIFNDMGDVTPPIVNQDFMWGFTGTRLEPKIINSTNSSVYINMNHQMSKVELVVETDAYNSTWSGSGSISDLSAGITTFAPQFVMMGVYPPRNYTGEENITGAIMPLPSPLIPVDTVDFTWPYTGTGTSWTSNPAYVYKSTHDTVNLIIRSVTVDGTVYTNATGNSGNGYPVNFSNLTLMPGRSYTLRVRLKNSNTTSPTPTLSVDQTTLAFAWDNQSVPQIVNVETNVPSGFTLSNISDWLTITSVSSTSFEVRPNSQNTTKFLRTGSITVNATGAHSQTVTITQDSDGAIYYSEYGAIGDGVTDDFDAIINTHAVANTAGLKVRADAGATYYIGKESKTAQIQTDTDWGDAKFIIDDSSVNIENRNRNIFNVSSKNSSIQITTVQALRKNQERLDISLPNASLIVVTDNTTMRYIREGPNQNNGAAQTDVFVVDNTGQIDMKAPIIWDFHTITAMIAYPIDSETLTIKGGHFTTIANQAESQYNYYARGISVSRSNVVIDGIKHTIVGELDHGAPYSGFVTLSNCTDVTVQNCTLSGHKPYTTIGAANTQVSMGTYDMSVNRANNVTVRNCDQYNDIHDSQFWGIFASNYSKNITFDHVAFSRFDAHMGVENATIKNSVLGYMGISIIGCGILHIENTKVCGSSFINLRYDYGSKWEGEVIIRNCEFVPRNGAMSDAILINGRNSGQHDFGYACYMPEKITIDGLVINDTNPPNNYAGPKIFADFNSAYTSEDFVEKYPYTITKEVEIKNLTIKSGKPYLISNNRFMFRNVNIIER